MPPTFVPGNRSAGKNTGEGGFVLLEALLCLFTGTLIVFLLEFLGAASLQISRKALEKSWELVEEKQETLFMGNSFYE